MRGKLINDFDEIYILNLHGNSRIGETCPDGSNDENIFDIMQGVSISLFIKKSNKARDCKVYYFDLWGLKKSKGDFLYQNTYKTIKFNKLNIDDFNDKFRKTRWGKSRFKDDLNFFKDIQDGFLVKVYGEFWGLNDIFRIIGSGVKTDRDNLLIDFNEENLYKKLKVAFSGNYSEDFRIKFKIYNSSSYHFKDRIQNTKLDKNNIIDVYYRPFDIRKEYYWIGFTSRPAQLITKHVVNRKNICIVFPRIWEIASEWSGINISIKLVDIHYNGGQSYIAPLYIYQSKNDHNRNENNNNDYLFKEDNKRDNFTKDFRQFIKSKYKDNYTPELILGYIYSVLHSPTYRTKYIEFLKIDFPRIPFTDNEELFKELANIGFELIEHHLLKKDYENNICQMHGATDNFKVEKVEYEKIPLSPPLKKGETQSLPLIKGDIEGFKKHLKA
jgi:predicted helicase